MQTLRILCFGNSLHSDDGIGSAVALRLRHAGLPDSVGVFDVGIAGLNAMPLFENCARVLIVDAADMGLTPGICCFIEPKELDETNHADHMGGVSYLLQAVLAIVEPMPHIDILAIQPARQQTFEPQLSPLLQSALDEVEKVIVEYVAANQLSQNHAARLASS